MLFPKLNCFESRTPAPFQIRSMISVVIPLHNEEANVPLLAAKLTAAMGAMGRDYEVIFINDGSQPRKAHSIPPASSVFNA